MSTETGGNGREAGAHDDDETYLTIEEFGRRSGMSASTVRRRIEAGRIAVYQPGGRGTRLAIPPAELRARPRCPQGRDDGAANRTGRPDHNTVRQPSPGSADASPPGSAAARPAGSRPEAGDPLQAHACTPQPPNRLPGPPPKWRRAALGRSVAHAPGVAPRTP